MACRETPNKLVATLPLSLLPPPLYLLPSLACLHHPLNFYLLSFLSPLSPCLSFPPLPISHSSCLPPFLVPSIWVFLFLIPLPSFWLQSFQIQGTLFGIHPHSVWMDVCIEIHFYYCPVHAELLFLCIADKSTKKQYLEFNESNYRAFAAGTVLRALHELTHLLSQQLYKTCSIILILQTRKPRHRTVQ